MIWSVLDPTLVTCDEELVERDEVFEVDAYDLVFSVQRGRQVSARGYKEGEKTPWTID